MAFHIYLTWGIPRTNRPIDCRDCRGKMWMNMMVMGPMGFGDRPFWKTKHCRWLTLVALKNCSIRSDCSEKTNPKQEVCPTRKVFFSQEILAIKKTHLNNLGKNLAFSDLNTLELTFLKCISMILGDEWMVPAIEKHVRISGMWWSRKVWLLLLPSAGAEWENPIGVTGSRTRRIPLAMRCYLSIC